MKENVKKSSSVVTGLLIEEEIDRSLCGLKDTYIFPLLWIVVRVINYSHV